MSEQKRINIDMNLFKVSNKTRKKKPGEKKEPGIRIKQPSQKKKNETIKKKSLLKMIRQHQQDRYNTIFDEKKKPDGKSHTDESDGFHKDFEEAQKFMQQLTEKTEVTNKTSPKNSTIKQYPTTPTSLLFHPVLDPLKEVTNSVMNTSISNTISPSNILLKPIVNNLANSTPNYGCLKNGTLPTYRNYMNKTQKIFTPQPVVVGGQGHVPMHVSNSVPSPSPKTYIENRNELVEKKLNESMNRINEMKQIEQKLQQLKTNNKPKKMKRKKTVRRTYKVGKSKMQPKVSILVSNKTIRNNISTKAQLLKQIPIEEVKKHLVKQGLIRVGTIAPNDVLRKMYESSILMCGEVHNHNPDYLLYNFLNGK